MQKKRYILFAMMDMYPFGGLEDAKDSFDNEREYKELKTYEKEGFDRFHVLDTETFDTYRSSNGKELPEVDFE